MGTERYVYALNAPYGHIWRSLVPVLSTKPGSCACVVSLRNEAEEEAERQKASSLIRRMDRNGDGEVRACVECPHQAHMGIFNPRKGA